MPSLRSRLGRKRAKTPKKSKSLGDLDDVESENNLDMSKDFASQISDVGNSSNVEGGANSEETTSQVSSTTDSHSGRKKRFSFKKIRRSLSRKKKTSIPEGETNTSLVETGNGALVLVQEFTLKDGQEDSNHSDEVKVRRTQSCTVHEFNVSETVGKKNRVTGKHLNESGKESRENGDRGSDEETVDEWRMAGLLGTVEKSNSIHSGSSRSNLALSSVDANSDKKKDPSPTDQNFTSTPKGKENVVPVPDFDLITESQPHKEQSLETVHGTDLKLEGDAPVKGVRFDVANSSVYTDVEPTTLEEDQEESSELCDKELAPLECAPVDLEEEKFCETHGLDYEYSSQDSKVDAVADVSAGGDSSSVVDGRPFAATNEVRLQVKYQGELKDEYDTGKGSKIVVRTLEDVLRSGDMQINEEILTNEWLVLNLAKDDWVIVDYNKANGEIIEIFDRSVEAI